MEISALEYMYTWQCYKNLCPSENSIHKTSIKHRDLSNPRNQHQSQNNSIPPSRCLNSKEIIIWWRQTWKPHLQIQQASQRLTRQHMWILPDSASSKILSKYRYTGYEKDHPPIVPCDDCHLPTLNSHLPCRFLINQSTFVFIPKPRSKVTEPRPDITPIH